MLIMWLLILSKKMACASPSVMFPINAQVPPVARVSQPFIFQFSQTTFTNAPEQASSIQYTLSDNSPAWVRLESDTRTIFGTPTAQDLGSAEFELIATDETGGTLMSVTLVTVDSSTPQAMGNISDQLAHFGTLSGPTTLTLYTNTPFDISFSSSTFTTISNPLYYATSEDRSPLPSWITFNSHTITFSGLTPPLIMSSQTFGITLFVSRVPGFAEAWFNFYLEIGTHELEFREVEKTVNISTSGAVNFEVSRSELLLDGQPINEEDISDISVQLPNWLQWNPRSMHIYGQAPSGTTNQEVNVSAVDIYGDKSTLVVNFQFVSSLFTKQVGIINVTMGTTFNYVFSRSLFSNPDVIVSVEIDAAVTWLHFNNDSLELSGTVPYISSLNLIGARITAHLPSSATTETQSFSIRILPVSPTTTVESRNAPPTSTETAPVQTSASQNNGLRQPDNISSGVWIGVGFTIGVVGLLLVGALLWYGWRKQLHKKPWISKPILNGTSFRRIQRKYHGEIPGGENGTADVEPGHLDEQHAPHLDQARSIGRLPGSSHGGYKISNGTILQPSDENLLQIMNRTSLGTDALNIHNAYSQRNMVPQIAKTSSQLSLMLPKRASHRSSISLLGHRISKLSQKRLSWASAGRDRKIQNRNSGNTVTLSTGDDHHADNTPSNVTKAPLTPLAKADPGHPDPAEAWIRCVSLGSDVIAGADSRPLADRRQSYIHHRASTNNRNPLFAASDTLSKHISAAYRPPLRQRSSNNSHRLVARAKFTRSKSSSIGVRTSAPSRLHMGTRRSIRSGDEWQTASSIYSGDESELVVDEDMDDENRSQFAGMEDALDLEEEREIKRNKWSYRLRRDGRGEIMDSITEGDALFSSKQGAGQGKATQRRGANSAARQRLVSTGTNASSMYGTDAFI